MLHKLYIDHCHNLHKLSSFIKKVKPIELASEIRSFGSLILLPYHFPAHPYPLPHPAKQKLLSPQLLPLRSFPLHHVPSTNNFINSIPEILSRHSSLVNPIVTSVRPALEKSAALSTNDLFYQTRTGNGLGSFFF